jgi:hypothetical protein
MSVSQTFAGLNRTKLLASDGTVTWQWLQGLNSLAAAASAPATSTVPATSSSPGNYGQMATDGTFLYIATGLNQWKRLALTEF